MNRLTLAATLVAGLSVSALAHGQHITKDADAERLFREGQKLLEERRLGEACPKFEAAYRKDQQLGTLLNLAYCHKEQGALWQAWLEFKEAELKAIELKRNERRDFARQRMAELEKQLARVVIDTGGKVQLSEVVVEEKLVPEAEKGQIFAAEPGQRKLTFRAKGKKDLSQLVTIAKSDKPQRIVVPEMEEYKEAPPPPPVEPPPAPVPEVVPKHEPPPPESSWSGMKTAALVVGGVGLAGIAVGSVFGVMTLGTENCRESDRRQCTDPGESEEAYRNATISTAGFIAGGALIATGLVLWILAPSSSAPSKRGSMSVVPRIGAGYAGVAGVF